MTPREKDAAARAYYAERYDEIVDYRFVNRPTDRLNDHDPKDPRSRRCRFCRRGPDEVSFKDKAHAVSELLGNKTIVSMNECVPCNDFFSREYENHLGNRLNFLLSVSQVKGKRGTPGYESPSGSVRIKHPGGNPSLHLSDKSPFDKAKATEGPFEFDLPADTTSPPHVPLRAVKALVKMACSICPPGDLPQCRRAIEWVGRGTGLEVSKYTVLRGFTPGPPEAFTSRAMLLRRKQAAGHEPFLWCVLQCLNHRFQFLVPGCPADDAIFGGGPATIPARNYRLADIPFDWPLGESQYWQEDWSSEEKTRISAAASFQVLCAEVVNGPTNAG